jgi:HPt (histidine-containing phosphotransfer) domain-containing protein
MSVEMTIQEQVRHHLQTVYQLEDEQITALMSAACKSLADNLSAADTALCDRDDQALGTAAHSLKGSLLNLGLEDLAAMAAEIESGVRQGRDMDVSSLLARIHHALKGFLDT